MPGWLRSFSAKVRGDSRREVEPEESLLACRACGATAAVPVAWGKYRDIQWWMHLRCGECGHRREVVVTDVDARRYERELDEGVDEIERALEQLHRERLAREADAFAVALERNLIDAADFAD